jgi:hypothetical protein
MAVAALALSVLAVMWARSYRVTEAAGYGWRYTGSDSADRTGFALLRSSGGAVHFGAGYILPIFLPSATVREGLFFDVRDAPPSKAQAAAAVWSLLGFSFHRIDFTGALVTRSFGVPYWFLMACTAAMLVLSWRRWRRARRASGLCANCGYDLRASRGRCPECGTPISGEAGADNAAAVTK